MIRSLSVAALLCGLAIPAFAQDAPAPTTRCTGVLCDLYYSNKPAPVAGQPEAPDPTHLPCHDFVCAAFGGRTPDAPPPAAEPVAAAEPAPAPVKKTAHRKHKAKVAVAEPSAEPAK